jgi:electron transport complex protein RnfB
MGTVSVADIDALLPQTQCTRCGYPGCLPYARAIAAGEADIDQCPPGGDAGAARLAALLGRPPRPVNPRFGTATPGIVAWIDEARCIGCARCLPPCPVDAIVGAARRMHTVLATECTGCELCLPACPVDCILLVPRPIPAGPDPTPAENRERYVAHGERESRRAAERARRLEERKRDAPVRDPS